MLRLALSSSCAMEAIQSAFGIPTEDSKTGFISVSAWSLMLFTLLYQGFSTCGVVLLFHADRVWEVLLGLAALASVVVMPFIGLRMIRSVVNENKAKYAIDPKKSCWTGLLGTGEWVSLRESSVERYGCLFQQYLPKAVFFLFVFECSLSLCFAFILAVYVETWVQCGYKKIALLMANAFYGLQLARLMPHRLPLVNGLELVVNILACLGLGTAAVACFAEDPVHHWGTGSSDMTFMLAAYTVLLKSVFCIGVVLFVVLNKRRARLQASEPLCKVPTTPIITKRRRSKIEPLTVAAEAFSYENELDARDQQFLEKSCTPLLWSPVSEPTSELLSFTKCNLSPGPCSGRTPASPRNRSNTCSWTTSQASPADSLRSVTAVGQLTTPGKLLARQPRRGRCSVYSGISGNSPSSPKSFVEPGFTPTFLSSVELSTSLQELHSREMQEKQGAVPSHHVKSLAV
ncbi:hypothetical protein DIPPA_24710 [Diplonema papillatum]|nr:hypothetical protein DIPPA_24710 [Diplonema papillatum]